MNQYTSFELSKKLWENGCRINKHEVPYPFTTYIDGKYVVVMEKNQETFYEKYLPLLGSFYPTHDILWDICVKYAKEFWRKSIQI